MFDAPLRMAAVAALCFIAGNALAAGSHTGGHGNPAGSPATTTEPTRTVEVVMYDNYYEPEDIRVQAGETVRFQVRNAGSLVHEFSIGTPTMHEAHQPMMQMLQEHGVLLPDRIDREAARVMETSMGHGMHEEANTVMLEPGQTADMVWTFPAEAPVSLEFACNIPGHYDSGMVGLIRLGNGS